jgi:hypothetical protein
MGVLMLLAGAAAALVTPPGCGMSSAKTDRLTWVLPHAYRIPITVEPCAGRHTNAPAGAAVDFNEVFREAGIPGRVDRNSIRVVRYDAVTTRAIPYHGAHRGYPIPHQMTGDWPNNDAGIIWWRMQDRTATHFHIYFDVLDDTLRPPPPVVGLVGVGDTFHYNDGRPGFANAVALHSQYWHIDWDGDGLRDLIGFSYRNYEHGTPLEKELGNGVFFYRNIGSPQEPLFAPKYRVKGADGEYLRTDLLPQNMFPDDWDADGDIDFFGAGRGNKLLLWENTGKRDQNGLHLLEQAKPLMTLNAKSEFRERAKGVIEAAWFAIRGLRRIDWESDGDHDLLISYRTVNKLRKVDPTRAVIPYGAGLLFFELWENKGVDEQGCPVYAKPRVIMEERGLPIHANSVATGCAEYVDWDGDGDCDLLFHDDTNRPLQGGVLMYAENFGSRTEPQFLMPVPLLGVWDSPYVVDWNTDGRFDLIAGSEFFENVNPRSGGDNPVVPPRTAAGTPKPHPETYPTLVSRGFAQQIQPEIISYFAVSVDWDGDGALDMLRGHHSNVLLFRNRGSTLDPVFERGVKLEAGAKPICMPNYLDLTAQPPAHWGPQGPSEAIYGWLNPAVGDWDDDGDLDLFITSQRWQTVYFENIGTRTVPRLAPGREVRCGSDPHEFSWRSKVSIGDLDGDGGQEMVVTSDRDNTFYMYERTEPGQNDPSGLELSRGEPLQLEDGKPVQGWYGGQNNNGDNHSVLADWDGDGDLDLLNGSLWAVWYYENVGTPTSPLFRARGRLQARGEVIHTFNHAGSVDAADWNQDGRLDLIVSAECPSDSPHGSVLHLFDRSFIEDELPAVTIGAVEARPADDRPVP